MTDPTAEASPRFKARLAGGFWLMTILTGAFALVSGGRFGIAINLIATACYAAATVLVYGLLTPVNRNLSLLAAVFSLVGCAIGASSAVFHLGAQVANLGFIFFGLHCLLVGCLILRSTFLPRTVGALMAFGGLGWLTLSLCDFAVAAARARSLPLHPDSRHPRGSLSDRVAPRGRRERSAVEGAGRRGVVGWRGT